MLQLHLEISPSDATPRQLPASHVVPVAHAVLACKQYLSAETEVTWYEATGAAHAPVPNQWLQESAVVWFRWKLLDDRDACAYWKAMPEGDAWDMKAETNAAPCE